VTIEAPVKEPRDLDGPDGVRVEVVSRTFAGRHGPVRALDGMSLRAGAGEIVAVVGPSGCGKTTLLELICGLQTPDSGTVFSAPAALMPQRDLLLPWLSAIDNAALALRLRGASRSAARAAAEPWMERFGLRGFERSRPSELSGGMRQRVSFLRSLLAGKPVLALDEPFASLDAITRAEMQGWLASVLATEQRTVVLVTHDVEEAVLLGDRVVVMSARPGRAVAELPVELARPRHRTDPEIVALRERALAALGVPT
jgi:NitT/TauT family transport system ATP-binding protein